MPERPSCEIVRLGPTFGINSSHTATHSHNPPVVMKFSSLLASSSLLLAGAAGLFALTVQAAEPRGPVITHKVYFDIEVRTCSIQR